MARKRTRSRAGSKAEQEFVSEAEEILERLRVDLADLDDQRTGGDEVDPDVINRLFRSAHSLKGLAGLFGSIRSTTWPPISRTSSTACGSVGFRSIPRRSA